MGEIVLHLYYLEDATDEILDVLMHQIEKNEEVRQDDDFSNLFRKELVSLYPSANCLIIDTYQRGSLSMIALLQLIAKSNLKKVVIKNGKWIEKLWQKEKATLTNQYNKNSFDILYNSRSFTI